MLKVTKEQKGNVIVAQLSGTIAEEDDFSKLIGEPPKGQSLEVDTKSVSFINAVGIKNWVSFFGSLRKKNILFTFKRFAACLVEQVSLSKEFTCGGRIESFAVPYSCPSCEHFFSVFYPTSLVTRQDLKTIRQVWCEKCGKAAHFDYHTNEYFEFLLRA